MKDHMAAVTLDAVLSRLDHVRRSGQGWLARCPAHLDRRPSLSIRSRDGGGVLLFCFAGCSYREILRALRLEPGSRAGGPTGPVDVHALALRIGRAQRWADPYTREMMATARAIRERYRLADQLRRVTTGATDAVWDALALAAYHEGIARLSEAIVDEVLAC